MEDLKITSHVSKVAQNGETGHSIPFIESNGSLTRGMEREKTQKYLQKYTLLLFIQLVGVVGVTVGVAYKRFGAKIESGLWAGLVTRNPKVWLVEHLAESMSNLASSTSGASVPLATSNDDKYPPEALIDGNQDTYWLSTGVFPQEIIVSFQSMVAMETILLRCSKVARLRVERSEEVSMGNFQAVTEKDTEAGDDNELQSLKFELPKMTARHIKFVIVKSFDHFVSFHSLIVTGSVIK